MSNDNSSNVGGGGCINSLGIPLVFGAIGYFVYGNIAGFFGTFLYALALSLVSLLGLIPIAGPILYVWLGNMAAIKLLAALSLTATTLTAVIFWWYFAMAVLVSLIILIVIAANK